MRFKESIDVPNPTFEHRFCYRLSRSHVRGRSVLNIGCWIGNYESFLSNSDAVGIDIEERALKVAKNYFPNVNFVLASVLSLPFRNEVFDVVTMWAVLEHIPVGTELLALPEVERVLTVEGHFFLSTANKHLLSDLMDPALFLVGHRHYRFGELRDLCEKSNFDVLTIEIKGGIILLLHTILFYLFKHILGTSIPRTSFIDNLLAKEYSRRGIVNTYVIIRKRRKNGTTEF